MGGDALGHPCAILRIDACIGGAPAKEGQKKQKNTIVTIVFFCFFWPSLAGEPPIILTGYF